MEKVRIAINGFGRIGRTVTRVLQNNHAVELVAVNDLVAADNLAHLLKYDSVHGRFAGAVVPGENGFTINGSMVQVINEKDPSRLPWKALDIDFVIESTGRFRTSELAQAHIDAGARHAIISAPAQDLDTPSIVMGINDDLLTGREKIVSNASCTTNSAAPLVKILQDNWGIEEAYISTIHSYTSDQRLHDAPHSDWRRGRAAAESIVPTSTGAAKAITRIFPELEGHMGGAGIRVPVPNGSLTDLSCMLRHAVSVDEINAAFKEAAHGKLRGILEYTEDPIVSRDIIGNPHSSVFDAQLTSALGRMIKVVGWYDNEWGYSNRLVDLMLKMHQLSKA
ncbi:MAG: type I glyceraldehyde-3-phosphate dehydrogenase [Flavobacteriales bacterium]|nr:type I glyceraldehyde-3-phosphate dehydrogenase [Flavobacteriales bacterium]